MKYVACWSLSLGMLVALLARGASAQDEAPAPAPAPKAPAPKAAPAPNLAKSFVATSPAQAGEDFFYQGEYEGTYVGGGRVGVQVVSLGDRQFEAVEFPGGLPGAGYTGGEKATYTGEREGYYLRLKNDARKLVLQAPDGAIRDLAGRQLAALKKVERRGPSLGAAPTPGAVVVFDGKPSTELTGAKIAADGTLMHGANIKGPVQSFFLHLEFKTPYMPLARGQARGNSGVYIQERYELQVLDSFGLKGEFNECGSVYRTRPPEINMCLPPLTWQTYDIYFRAAQFSPDGKKTANAELSVYHNGVLVQTRYSLPNKTGAGQPEGPTARPIKLQDHGDPVRYRNIWMVLPESK